MKVGVLSLQGGVEEHVVAIEKLGNEAILVKKQEDLDDIDAIILPGGESTTMGRLLRVTGLLEPLKKKIEAGLPTWGTCAGMILLAKEIENDDRKHLELMDICVRRNAFGTQIDSFTTRKVIEEISDKEIEMVFIRAPFIVSANDNVKVLCEVDENIVVARQDNILATSFHPELTDDTRVLEYFLNNVK